MVAADVLFQFRLVLSLFSNQMSYLAIRPYSSMIVHGYFVMFVRTVFFHG